MNEAPTADGGPGFLAFLAFFLLALALWFLMRNMNARMRRMSYRQQAAHRGKDDPQVAPDELAAATDAPVAGPTDATEAGPDVTDTGKGTTGPDDPGPDDAGPTAAR
jgi:hypothetical protein